jgi:hypothetical protein
VVERWCNLFGGDVIVNRWWSGELLSGAEEIVVKSVIEEWRERMFDLSWLWIRGQSYCKVFYQFAPD